MELHFDPFYKKGLTALFVRYYPYGIFTRNKKATFPSEDDVLY